MKRARKRLLSVITIAMMTASIFQSVSITKVSAAGFQDTKILDLKFDGNITDSSANAINATWHGDQANYVEGTSGQAAKFNGKNNYIDLGTSAALQPQNLTVSFWLKPDDKLSGEHMIVWNKPSGKWSGDGWYLSCLDDNTPLKLSTGTGVQESYVSGDRNTFFPVGQWTHVAVTYDNATKNVAIYRNGVAQKVYYNKQAGSILANSTDNKYIGFNSPGYNGGYAKLNLDELEMYSSVATSDDVKAIFKAEGGTIDEGKLAQLDLDGITLPTETRGSLTLPTKGQNESTISWKSSNKNIISDTGAFTMPDADTSVTLTATVVNGSKTLTKEFTILAKTSKYIGETGVVKQFDMQDVNITDPFYVNAYNQDLNYLLSLDPQKLLTGFKAVADGKDPGANGVADQYGGLYGGWEGGWSLLRGHSIGHYMTALAQAYKETQVDDPAANAQIKAKLDAVISGLKACQDKSPTGYVFASPETHFDVVEGKVTGSQWVPWYTMHKIIAGLVDTYKYEGNNDALVVASKLGDWTYNRTSKWDSALRSRVLNVEYGGMNDCLYELYKYTQNANHLAAAHIFDEDTLFTPIGQGNDILANVHANMTIPKFIGAVNRYRTLGKDESFYLNTAEKFWDMVLNHHSYVTGGNSENEHFRTPDKLDAQRDDVNDESCNAYNMQKLSRELFKATGDVKYLNAYANTFLNEIMSAENPETGLSTYFKPMGTGYFKYFSSATNDFWCCTGTGMENYTKLDDSVYFYDDNNLYVSLYLSSTLNWKEKGLKLTQTADLPNSDKVTFTVNAANAQAVNIKFRAPEWVAQGQKATVTVNGQEVDSSIVDGYINVNKAWNVGDKVELTFPMEVQASRLPDNKDAVAFTYGPVVLSAGLGTDKMTKEEGGVVGHLAVSKAAIPSGLNIKDYILIKDGTVDNWISNLKNNLVKTDGKIEFTLRGTDEDNNLKFTPQYLRYKDRYGIYFNMSALDSPTFQQTILNKKNTDKKIDATIDSVQVTNDQHELAHNMVSKNSSTGSFGGYQYRTAKGTNDGDAWFTYDMAVNPSVTNYLSVKYYSGDAGRTFNIYVNDQLLKKETIQAKNPTGFYDVLYQLPAELINGKTKVTIKFSNIGTSYVGSAFNVVSIMKPYDTNANLSAVTAGGAAGTLTDSNCNISVPAGTTTADIKFTPANKNALVYIGDVLIDDTAARKIALTGDTTTLNVKVVAEDGVTQKAYTVTISNKADNGSSNDFTIKSNFNLSSLQADKTLDVKTTVTNNKGVCPSVLVIVSLYDSNDKMVNVSYISKNIPIGDTENLNSGFKLPGDVNGYKAKVFVWDGENITSSTMQPLSNMVTLP